MLKVLVIDHDSTRRSAMDEALSWICDDYELLESADMTGACQHIGRQDISFVTVGPDLSGGAIAALSFLRRRLPGVPLLAASRMSLIDSQLTDLLLDSGADSVFDARMSSVQLAEVIYPFLRKAINGGKPFSATSLAIA